MKHASRDYAVSAQRSDNIGVMNEPNCVGALIRNRYNQVYIQRRSLQRRQLPGAWDVVGGHVEPGETTESALAREVREETGWSLRRIEAVVADWKWTHNDVTRREVDFLVEVDGDLSQPRLEPGKHDLFSWVGFEDTDSMRSARDAGNDALWSIIKRATRIRLTSDLRLEPIEARSADALRQFYADGPAGLALAIRAGETPRAAADHGDDWEFGRAYSWLAYSRRTPGRAVGSGGLVRTMIRGSQHLALECTVRSGPQQLEVAVEIVNAALAFAHHELHADEVYARVAPPTRIAREVMARCGMEHVGAESSGGRRAELFRVRSLDEPRFDFDQDVVTGIGQILAVRT
jgi:8-oxo-dGTP pyrophosphatase MutT (NUDIX family)